MRRKVGCSTGTILIGVLVVAVVVIDVVGIIGEGGRMSHDDNVPSKREML